MIQLQATLYDVCVCMPMCVFARLEVKCGKPVCLFAHARTVHTHALIGVKACCEALSLSLKEYCMFDCVSPNLQLVLKFKRNVVGGGFSLTAAS